MTLDVAIAAEAPYDTEIFRTLTELLLGRNIRAWNGGMTFTGCKGVAKHAPQFIGAAAQAGIAHVLLAIDNDGGGVRRPEHTPACVAPVFNLNDNVSCRECWLQQRVPSSWGKAGERHCVVVPVQAIETWLLAIRGHNFGVAPEKVFHRSNLKPRFFGKPQPDAKGCLALAKAELSKPHALATLAQRPSFQRFANTLATW